MYLRVFLSLLFLPNFLLASYKYETIVDDLDDAWSMVLLMKIPFYLQNFLVI